MNKQQRRIIRRKIVAALAFAICIILFLKWLPVDLTSEERSWLKELETRIGQKNNASDPEMTHLYARVMRFAQKNTPHRLVGDKESEIEKCNHDFDQTFSQAGADRKKLEGITENAASTPEEATALNAQAEKYAEDIRQKRVRAEELTANARNLLKDIHIINSSLQGQQSESAETIGKELKDNMATLQTLEKEWKDMGTGRKFKYFGEKLGKYVKKVKSRIGLVRKQWGDIGNEIKNLKVGYENVWNEERDKKIKGMLSEMQEKLKRFPSDAYKSVAVGQKKPSSFTLMPGQSEICVAVPSKPLADDLVEPLLHKWADSKQYKVIDTRKDSQERGSRYVLQSKDGKIRNADVIIRPGEEWHPHLSVSLSLVTDGENAKDAVCSDALIFFTDESEALTEMNINKSPWNSADTSDPYLESAIALFRMGEKEGQPLTTELYHKHQRWTKSDTKVLKVARPGGKAAVEASEASIAQQLYAYGFHIRFTSGEETSEYAKQFREYLKSDKASAEIRSLGFVPISAKQRTDIREFGNDKLPITRILALMTDIQNDKKANRGAREIIQAIGYSDNDKFFRGIEIENCPIFFDTKNAETIQLDVHNTSSLDDIQTEIADTLAELHKRYDKLMVIVTGHADVRSGDNMRLSRGRALTFLRDAVEARLNEEQQQNKRDWGKLMTVRGNNASDHVHLLLGNVQGKGIILLSVGCSDEMHYVEKKQIDGAEADKYYRRDRRVAIYIIIPKYQ